MQSLVEKFCSRKFWLAVAAFLASIGTSIGAIATANENLAIAGVVCAAVSTAIYAAAEAYVDGQSISANTSTTTTNVTASTTARETVEKMLVTNTSTEKTG